MRVAGSGDMSLRPDPAGRWGLYPLDYTNGGGDDREYAQDPSIPDLKVEREKNEIPQHRHRDRESKQPQCECSATEGEPDIPRPVPPDGISNDHRRYDKRQDHEASGEHL